jgi:NAD-dependent SIR2 family protein deacetylase
MDVVRTDGSAARVQCETCEFLWYGATAAHGLSIIGHCPRCGGSLQFREEPGSSSAVAAGPATLDPEPAHLEPAQVLGAPQTWNR